MNNQYQSVSLNSVLNFVFFKYSTLIKSIALDFSKSNNVIHDPGRSRRRSVWTAFYRKAVTRGVFRVSICDDEILRNAYRICVSPVFCVFSPRNGLQFARILGRSVATGKRNFCNVLAWLRAYWRYLTRL